MHSPVLGNEQPQAAICAGDWLYLILSKVVGFLKNERLRCCSSCTVWSQLGLLDNIRRMKMSICTQQMVREYISVAFVVF